MFLDSIERSKPHGVTLETSKMALRKFRTTCVHKSMGRPRAGLPTVLHEADCRERENMKLRNVSAEIIAKKLRLLKVPEFIPCDERPFVMAALYTYEAESTPDNPYKRVITNMESDYVILVNPGKLKKRQDEYLKLTGSQQAVDDMTLGIVLHEFRHVWQAENGMLLGTTVDAKVNTLYELTYGHGSIPTEKDANDWMCKMARGRKQRALFHYMRLTQIKNGTEYRDSEEFQAKLKAAENKVVRLYR